MRHNIRASASFENVFRCVCELVEVSTSGEEDLLFKFHVIVASFVALTNSFAVRNFLAIKLSTSSFLRSWIEYLLRC
jgi:hypothetical protein